jgi:colicin import membrane protein
MDQKTGELMPTQEEIGAIKKLEHDAEALEIRTPEEYDLTIEAVKEIKRKRKAIVEFFSDPKKKARAAWQSIRDKEKEFTDRLDAIEAAVKKEIMRYDDEQEEKRLEEERRLQRIADEKARKEREKNERAAEKQRAIEEAAREKAEAARKAAADADEAEQKRLLAEAEKAQKKADDAAAKADEKEEDAAIAAAAPAVEVSAPAPKAKGKSTSKTYKAELENIDELISAAAGGNPLAKSFLAFNQKSANSFAVSNKDNIPVPGVKFVPKKSINIRAGGK